MNKKPGLGLTLEALAEMLNKPVHMLLSGLEFRGHDISPANISAPLPTRRYMAALRHAAQNPTRRRG